MKIKVVIILLIFNIILQLSSASHLKSKNELANNNPVTSNIEILKKQILEEKNKITNLKNKINSKKII